MSAKTPDPPPDRPPAWTNDDELQALVQRLLKPQDLDWGYRWTPEAWVEGRSIPELRELIEAFIAAARANPDLKGRVVVRGTNEETRKNTQPVLLRLRNCTVESCQCPDLDIACALEANQCHFSDLAWFHGATIAGGLKFEGTTFADSACFDKAIISNGVLFTEVMLKANAMFRGARFSDSDMALFDRATFHGAAWFERATFSGGVRFNDAAFTGEVAGDLRLADTRCARFGRAVGGAERVGRRLDWEFVRALGELDVLTRVSYIVLVAAPPLAAVWPAVRGTVNAVHEAAARWRPPVIPSAGAPPLPSPDSPLSLALAFFAAAAVTIARALYQTSAPAALREVDERRFIERKAARYESLRDAGPHAPAANDALRDATEKIAALSRVRPDRHANFVSRFGETMWIPPTDRVDWFQDPEPPGDQPAPEPSASEERADGRDSDAAGARASGAPTPAGAPHEGRDVRPPSVGDPGIVSGAERARVAIEEGARAEYRLLALENPSRARGAAHAYGIGVSLVLVIFAIQLWRVAHESSAWAMAALVLSVGVVLVIGAWWFGFRRWKSGRACLGGPGAPWLWLESVWQRWRARPRGPGPWLALRRPSRTQPEESNDD